MDCGAEFFTCEIEPDHSILTIAELQTLLLIKEFFKNYNSKRIVEFSHEERAYQVTQNREIISYMYSDDLRVYNVNCATIDEHSQRQFFVEDDAKSPLMGVGLGLHLTKECLRPGWPGLFQPARPEPTYSFAAPLSGQLLQKAATGA